MALQTGGIGIHARGELIVRLTLMKRMTRKATQFPTLITSRLRQTVELAPRNANHSVGPIPILDKSGHLLLQRFEPRLALLLERTHHRCVRIQILARSIGKAVLAVLSAVDDAFDAV